MLAFHYRPNHEVVEPYAPPTWADGTDAEIAEAVAKADAGEFDLSDYWSVGDERTVHLGAMAKSGTNDYGSWYVGETHAAQDVILVIMNEGYSVSGCNNSHVHFVVGLKHSLNETGYINAHNDSRWTDSYRRGWCKSIFYASFPDALKPIFKLFKTKTANNGGSNYSANDTSNERFALFAGREVFNTEFSYKTSYGGGYSIYKEHQVLTQITWYATSSNRIKQISGNNSYWWTRSPWYGGTQQFCYVNNQGEAKSAYATQNFGLAPFGCI